MSSQFIDLHMHTTASDGVHAPLRVLEIVRTKNLLAFSITDHDTIEGFQTLNPMMQVSDPELISGVELSVNVDGDDVHMLAYLFDPHYAPFTAALDHFKERRAERGAKIVHRLQQLSMPITFEDVQHTANGAAVGRPHIAETLIRLGHVSSIEEAFRKYIGYDGPAYVAKTTWTPQEAIQMVHDAGGVAVMAHPGIANMYKHIPRMATLGLDGIELFHYAHSAEQITLFKKIAETYNLLTTGGSDYHGRSSREGSIGSQRVPANVLESLKARVAT